MSKYIATASRDSALVTGVKLPVLCIFKSHTNVVYYVVPRVEDSYYKRYSARHGKLYSSQLFELKNDKSIEVIYMVENILDNTDALPYIRASEFERELIIND